jgi:hypothetical protein
MDKEITVIVSPDGQELDGDAKGFVGTECESVMNQITKGIGEIQDSGKKDEYFQTDSSGVHVGS